MFRKLSQSSKFCSRRAASATAAALMFAFSGAVAAQPAGPMAGPHGGPGGHGIEQMIAEAKSRLNLNTSQQAMFDNALAQSKAAHGTSRTQRQRVHDAMKSEIAKAEPDLAAMAAIADDAEQQGRALRRQVRDQRLKVYATFSVEQKAIVRDIMQQKMARAESFRQKMFERMHGG